MHKYLLKFSFIAFDSKLIQIKQNLQILFRAMKIIKAQHDYNIQYKYHLQFKKHTFKY